MTKMKLSCFLSCFLILGCLVSCFPKKSSFPTAELSFADFVLGGSFADCYMAATNNEEYTAISRAEDGLISKASFRLKIPDFNNPDQQVKLRGDVYAYRDTIYSIILSARDYEGGYSLDDMYEAKYGEREKEQGSKIWEFENASILIRTNVYSHTRWGNIFLDSTVCKVFYSDKAIAKSVSAYKDLEHEKEIARLRQQEQDKLDRIAAKEVEEEKRKNESQKELLENFNF